MADTFGDIMRQLKLDCPRVDTGLLRLWVQRGYRKLCDEKNWSFLRKSGDVVFKAARSGICTVTQYSDVVVPGTLTFSSADVGRQFRVGSTGIPVNIKEISGANAILSYPYNDATSTSTASVLDAFWTAPEDFGHFVPLSVTDPVNGWIIRNNVQEAVLNRLDPMRTNSGDLRLLVSRELSQESGQIQFEAWPYQTSAHRFPCIYYRRPPTLSDFDTFGGPFRSRSDVVVLAALWWSAMWPGDGEFKNPYFGIEKAQGIRKAIDDELDRLIGKDEDIFLTSIAPQGMDRWRWAPMDSNWAAEHDSPAY